MGFFPNLTLFHWKLKRGIKIKILLVQNPRRAEQGGTQTLGERKVKKSESGDQVRWRDYLCLLMEKSCQAHQRSDLRRDARRPKDLSGECHP